MCTLIYETISFLFFFLQISASISKQITCNHFGLSFEADSDRTVFYVLPKNQSAMQMIHLSSLLSAERAGCHDAECSDEKQVFVQLRSEVRDSKDSDASVASRPRRRWRRRNRRYNPYHPYGPSTTTSTTTRTTTSTTTSTTSSTTPIPVCQRAGRTYSAENTAEVDFPADVTTPVLLEVEEAAGCCVEPGLSLRVDVEFILLANTTGNLTVSLETPDMQSQELGVALPGEAFGKSVDIFSRARAGGVWNLTFVHLGRLAFEAHSRELLLWEIIDGSKKR